MSKQGFRFAPADGNNEYVYDVLYGQLVDYYARLNSLRMAVQSNVDDVQQIAQRDEELFKTQHQSVMEELERALKAEPPRDFALQFVDLAIGIRAIADAAALNWGR